MTQHQADGVSELLEQITRVVEKSSHKGGPEYVARSVIEAMRAIDPVLADAKRLLDATDTHAREICEPLHLEEREALRAALSRSERKDGR